MCALQLIDRANLFEAVRRRAFEKIGRQCHVMKSSGKQKQETATQHDVEHGDNVSIIIIIIIFWKLLAACEQFIDHLMRRQLCLS